MHATSRARRSLSRKFYGGGAPRPLLGKKRLACSVYRLFKTRLEFEPYLNLPRHIRIQLARLRSSSHSLRIETGRYSLPKPTPLEERLCPSCIEIEDETHFLITCRLWRGHYRDELFNCCRSLNSSFPHMSSIDKLIFILLSKNVHIIWLTGVFVYQSFMAKRKP